MKSSQRLANGQLVAPPSAAPGAGTVPSLTNDVAPRVFVVVNFKGGVGKTTTAMNLAAAWVEAGRRVLLVDLDPSSLLSQILGVNITGMNDRAVHHLLLGQARLEEITRRVTYRVGSKVYHLDLAPSSRWLATVVPMTFSDPHYYEWLGRALGLARYPAWRFDEVDDEESRAVGVHPLEPSEWPYDVVILDCPPTEERLTLLALRAATDVIVAVQAEGGAVYNLGRLTGLIRTMKRENPALRSHRYVLTMLSQRTGTGQVVMDEVRRKYAGQVCTNSIPRTIKFSDAMISQRPLLWYDPRCEAAESYRRLAEELWGGAA